MRIYEGVSMKLVHEVPCPATILAIEFIHDKNAVAVCLSDRSILFYEAMNVNNKISRKLEVPTTQRCMCYVKRKSVLFTAGTNGMIFGWNIAYIFSN